MSNLALKSIPVLAAIIGMGTGYTFFKPIILEQLKKDGALNPQVAKQIEEAEMRETQQSSTIQSIESLESQSTDSSKE